MTTSEFKQGQVALACWRAAKGELHQVMLAVCQVFMNRAAAGWYDGDLYENVIRWLAENPGEFPDTRDPQFQSLLARLDTVISGMASDKTGGALYFAQGFEDEILVGGFTITTKIGGLTFVK